METHEVLMSKIERGDYFSVRMCSDRMAPTIPRGADVWADLTLPVRVGDVVLAASRSPRLRLYVRRLDHWIGDRATLRTEDGRRARGLYAVVGRIRGVSWPIGQSIQHQPHSLTAS